MDFYIIYFYIYLLLFTLTKYQQLAHHIVADEHQHRRHKGGDISVDSHHAKDLPYHQIQYESGHPGKNKLGNLLQHGLMALKYKPPVGKIGKCHPGHPVDGTHHRIFKRRRVKGIAKQQPACQEHGTPGHQSSQDAHHQICDHLFILFHQTFYFFNHVSPLSPKIFLLHTFFLLYYGGTGLSSLFSPLMDWCFYSYGLAFLLLEISFSGIDDIPGLALLECLYVFGYLFHAAGAGLHAGPGQMGRDNQPAAVLYTAQRIGGLQGLSIHHIQSGSGDLPFHQRFVQSRIVHHGSPGHIDQNRRPFHLPQGLPVDDPTGQCAQGTMQGQNIALRQKGFLVRLGIVPAAAGPGHGVKNHPAAKSSGNPCHPAADVPHADNAPGHTLQFMKRKVKVRESVLGTVGSGLHILVIVGKFFQQGQRQGEGVLGHHARAVIHHIAYLDPPALTVGEIHIVKAGGQFADQADMGRVFQGLLPERSLIGHDNLRVPHPLTDFLNRGGIVVVNPRLPGFVGSLDSPGFLSQPAAHRDHIHSFFGAASGRYGIQVFPGIPVPSLSPGRRVRPKEHLHVLLGHPHAPGQVVLQIVHQIDLQYPSFSLQVHNGRDGKKQIKPKHTGYVKGKDLSHGAARHNASAHAHPCTDYGQKHQLP